MSHDKCIGKEEHYFITTFQGQRCTKCGIIKKIKLTDWHPFGVDYSEGKNSLFQH